MLKAVRHDLLAGIAVCEMGAGAAVRYAGRLLADAGATVTRVVSGPEALAPSWAAALDFDKEVVAEGGPAAAERIAAARILLLGDGVETARGGVAETARGGVAAIRVRVHGGDDLVLQASAGACAGTGLSGRPPLKLPLDQSSFQGGVVAAIAACAELGVVGDKGGKTPPLPLREGVGGRGQPGTTLRSAPSPCPLPQGEGEASPGCDIDLSTADVWASFYAGPEVANARFGRSRTRRAGHRARGVPWPRTIMRCRDGWFAVQCATREHWRRFLELTGRPELESAPLFADRIRTNDRHGDEAEAVFADWFAARTKDELLQAFLGAKLPGAPVYTPSEVAAHPHLAARGAFRHVPGPAGNVLAPNPPYRVIDGPAAAPHSRETAARSGGAAASEGPGSTVAAASPAHPVATMATPLAGLRVLDFGWVWAGAVPGHILADLGAEVIKVESGLRLDYMRQGRPIVGKERDPEQNPMFQSVNRGKQSLRVDMARPEGAALLRELASRCDVVIENFTPGVLDKFGLGRDRLCRENPGLIMCSMSAAGADGPLRDIRTYATMIAGLCGLDSLVAYPGERVLGTQSSYADPNASLHAAFAILAALERRRRTGRGAWIDLSQWEAGVAVTGEALAALPLPAAAPAMAPHGLYPAAGEDQWIALAAADDAQFAALTALLGTPPALADGRFASNAARLAARADLDSAVADATRTMDAATLAAGCAEAGIAAAALAAPGTLAGQQPFAWLYQDVTHPILGGVPVYRLPWRINGNAIPLLRGAPLLGEHNDSVLHDVLHLPETKWMSLQGADVLV